MESEDSLVPSCGGAHDDTNADSLTTPEVQGKIGFSDHGPYKFNVPVVPPRVSMNALFMIMMQLF